MKDGDPELALAAFHRAAEGVPAYRELLAEAGISPADVRSAVDFARLPILDKHNTFARFPIHELCVDGQVGRPASVLTSSGHSGVFAFGLCEVEEARAAAGYIDDWLDVLFAVRSRLTLLVNCLPMGVRVPSDACTQGDTSVRPDMAVGLIQGFARYFEQVLLVGEIAFIKCLLELGEQRGVEWRSMRVHVIVGEEPMAENARKHIQEILGTDSHGDGRGIVTTSMGVGELGLNLFCEAPPLGPLMDLRRALLDDPPFREELLGPGATIAPLVFTYDPRRIRVEFLDGHGLVVTTLAPDRHIPLIRYAPGDFGRHLVLEDRHRPSIESKGLPFDLLQRLPTVLIHGRGKCAWAGNEPAYPEQVKEGIYHDRRLARLTTANFRLKGMGSHVLVRVQLSPGVRPDRATEAQFADAICRYVPAPIVVRCQTYEEFGSGMSLDYERKFDYLGD